MIIAGNSIYSIYTTRVTPSDRTVTILVFLSFIYARILGLNIDQIRLNTNKTPMWQLTFLQTYNLNLLTNDSYTQRSKV